MARRCFPLLLIVLLAASPVSAKRFGGGGNHGTHSSGHTPPNTPSATPHADAPHPADAPQADSGPSLTVRPHIQHDGEDEAEEEPAQQQVTTIDSGGSGIHTGYLLLGFAGPLLFVAFRLRKFFRLRNGKSGREADFAQNMLMQHGRMPGSDQPATPATAHRATSPDNGSPPASSSMPDGSSVDAFIRQARASFLHLRTLNQAMNGEEIRSYLSPALVEKLRPSLPKNAEAVKFPILKAELLESAGNGGSQHARLRFYGTVKLSTSAPVFEFSETWLFSKAGVFDSWQVEDIIRNDKPDTA